MKFKAGKYFLILLTFAQYSYYGTWIVISNRAESNLGKTFDILNKELLELTVDHNHFKTSNLVLLLTFQFILQLCKFIIDRFHQT